LNENKKRPKLRSERMLEDEYENFLILGTEKADTNKNTRCKENHPRIEDEGKHQTQTFDILANDGKNSIWN